jgi:hypothetical protein
MAKTKDEGNKGNGEVTNDLPNGDPNTVLPSANPSPQTSGDKKRVKCAAIAGRKIVIGDKTVQADENGIIEVDDAQFKRLLTIPAYSEV